LTDDSNISFSEVYPADVLGAPGSIGARIPDAIGWSGDGSTLFTADEGEEAFEGGRGWSAHHASGGLFYDDGGELERLAVRFGHYPDGRSDAKGIETEGLAVATFGSQEFVFVTSERGSFLAVYRLDGQNRAQFVELLGTGQGPECVLPIPARHLVLTANEGDDGDGSISIFVGIPGQRRVADNRPQIVSDSVAEPWGALSGLAASRHNPQLLYAVPDNALPSAIFSIMLNGPHARIARHVPVTLFGQQTLYDLEGITLDISIRRPSRDAGFWLAAEGNASSDPAARTRNALIQVDSDGHVLEEILLPADIDGVGGKMTGNGFEGVALSGDGRHLLVSVQRPFTGDAPIGGVTHTRIARYDLQLNTWEAFFYPLQNSPGTIGLSEITLLGRTEAGEDLYAVIERDNRLAGSATLKRIYAFTLAGLTPVDIGVASDPANAAVVAAARVTKTLFEDVLPAFAPYEKVEGLTATALGDVWVVLDNDGGEFESRFVRIR
jgi:hypothetical protein